MDIQIIVDGTISKTIPNYFVGLLEIDIDPMAERIVILDRNTLRTIYANVRGVSSILKVILPLQYSSGSNLIVGIVDIDLEYSAQFLDGINASIVDGNTL